MNRGARRHRHSRSRSSSKSRSRSRDDRTKSNRNNNEKRSTKRHKTHRSKSSQHKNKLHHHKSHSPKKSIIKSEDNKLKFEDKKSVKFDETANNDTENDKEDKKKEDFNASGALKRDLETTKNGVVLKYNEPPEGTLSTHRKWRLYVYKNDEQINLFYLHRKSFYLIGRDHRVTDILCRHISISSQHAVIQYRRVKSSDKGCIVKPYIMDLKSRHGTYLMGDKIEPHRFYELLPTDKIQFGRSTREYIVLADDSNEKDVTHKSEIHISDDDDGKNIQQEQEKYNIWSDDD